jgi:hypothetical protein
MLNAEHFAITLARAVDLFRTHPHAIPDQKTSLRALVALTRLEALRVTVEDRRLMVDDTVVPRTLPAIATLTSTLERLGVSEIRFAQHASPADLLQLLRALAVAPERESEQGGVERKVGESPAATISVLRIRSETLLLGEEPRRVTEAFEAVVGAIPPIGGAPPDTNETAGKPLDRLRAGPYTGNVLDTLLGVSDDVVAALERGEPAAAVAALRVILDCEAEAPEGPASRGYGLALRRLLTPEVVGKLVTLVPDRDLGSAAARVMRRAGADGTAALLRKLAEAPTMDERLAYFDALRHISEGTDLVVAMLDHHRWYVVRNVADLVGELALDTAVPALDKAIGHHDARVQRSAARALARVGSNAAFDTLRRVLQGTDAERKLMAAGVVEGRGAAILVSSLVAAATDDPDVARRREYYRALGRIGSTEAVQALLRAVEPGGRLFKRKPSDARIAAIEGLALVGGPAIVGTLERLLRDRDTDVRASAKQALETANR